MNNLVIVESPTKARTLSRLLGKDYRIEASMGHIRDLPKSEMGIDIEHNFEPKYIVPRDKRKKVNELQKLAQDSKTIWLATDPDREGEAIAWHLEKLLTEDKGKKTPKKDIHRVEFHEITEGAIKSAFEHPREINIDLVDAQQGRRVLDRLVGYSLSPLLWKKVKRGLSAGRVQTVALRLIVEREKEIGAFTPIEYWSIEVQFVLERGEKLNFTAMLIFKNGEKIEIHTESEAMQIVSDLEKAKYKVATINKKEVRRNPAAPFTTSTLQQTAGNRLHFSAKKTMTLAQNLYEQGFITYMRTDSVNLATVAVEAIREHVEKSFGKNYLPDAPRIFKAKSKNAQEAHEAIRPTKFDLVPDDINADGFSRDHKRLYELIWKRAMASQMSEAVIDQTSVDISTDLNPTYILRSTGSILKFDGWMKLYQIVKAKSVETDEGDEETDGENDILPEMSEGETLEQQNINPLQHFTEPPPRYTEASLIKKLEELGIGRPSTYAPTLSTIQDRFYVERVERKFVPTTLGLTVTEFLIKYFPDVFDYTFTAKMENNLDEVAEGKSTWQDSLGEFYDPFEKKIEKTLSEASHVELPVEKVDKKCPVCGKDLVVRTGKFGKFLACSGFPDCKHTEPFEEKIDAKCPTDGGDVVVRKTKKGKTFYGCKNYPNCTWASWNRPKTEEVNTDQSSIGNQSQLDQSNVSTNQQESTQEASKEHI